MRIPMYRYFSYVLFLFAAVITISAQDDGLQKSSSKPQFNRLEYNVIDKSIVKSIDKFFNQLIKKNVREGFDGILNNSVISLKREEVDNLKKQTERSIDIYGDILSFEFVSAEQVTESYIRLRYLALHSSYPMRWIFTYYRSPDKNWIVTNVKFDDLSEYFFSD